jgi:hypothetical protein
MNNINIKENVKFKIPWEHKTFIYSLPKSYKYIQLDFNTE